MTYGIMALLTLLIIIGIIRLLWPVIKIVIWVGLILLIAVIIELGGLKNTEKAFDKAIGNPQYTHQTQENNQ